MTPRTGAALATVLFAMALVSALAVGGAYVTRSLAISTRLTRDAWASRAPAEQAVITLVAQWDSIARADQPIGAVVAEPERAIDGAWVASWVTRLSVRTYWIVAEARADPRAPMRRRLGLLVQSFGSAVQPVPGSAWAQLP